MKKILVLYAHPSPAETRVNRACIEALRESNGITIHDLYSLYPDFVVNVKKEQSLLLEHDLIVFHHPIRWYSCPALLKEWIDLVLERGFAYGRGGTALAGKELLQAVSAGGPKSAYGPDGYHFYSLAEFLRPFERTASLCNMKYLDPFVIYDANEIDDSSLEKASAEYKRLLLSYQTS